MTTTKDIFLVLGGDVFVGRHVVERLQARGEIVSAFDTTQNHVDVPFYHGDICTPEEISSAIQKVRGVTRGMWRVFLIFQTERSDLYYSHHISFVYSKPR